MLNAMPTFQTQESSGRTAFYPFSERKRVVELYESGLGSERISAATGIDSSIVRRWIRRYREHGLESLRPYWRPDRTLGVRASRRSDNERRFKVAYTAYATSLEPVSSITRRYRLDYNSFKYHVERFHPELVEQRKRLTSASTI